MCKGNGSFTIEGCPRKYVRELAPAINLASIADKGPMPILGGILDQSAWFIDVWQLLGSEQNQIDSDRIDRAKRG